MKKLPFILLFILTLSFACSCSQNSTNLEGYWLDEYGNSLSFDGTSQVVADNQSGTYNIYDDNKMTIDFGGYVIDYSFSIDASTKTLTLHDLESGISYIYYGNEETQNEIRYALRLAAQEQALLDSQLAADQELSEKISSLQSQITDIDKKISGLQYNISYEQSTIEMYQSDIAREGTENPDLAETWQDLISISQENISRYLSEIEGLEAKKGTLQAELSSLQ